MVSSSLILVEFRGNRDPNEALVPPKCPRRQIRNAFHCRQCNMPQFGGNASLFPFSLFFLT